MSLPAMTSDKKGFQNYVRLALLLNNGTDILRSLLKTRYKNLTGIKWEDTPTTGKKSIESFFNSLSNSKKKIQPLQQKMVQSRNPKYFDLNFLSGLLQNPSLQGSSDPTKFREENDSLKKLTGVRNTCAHFHDLRYLSTALFSELWTEVTSILILLGGDAEEFEKIRTTPATHLLTLNLEDDSTYPPSENEMAARKLCDDGETCLFRSEFESAIRHFEQAIEMEDISLKDIQRVYLGRSSALLQSIQGSHCFEEVQLNCERALRDGKKLIDLRPAYWKGYERVGEIFRRLKDWRGAIQAFNQALGLKPGDPPLLKQRDECRFEERMESAQQHLDPYSMPHSLAEELNIASEERGLDLKEEIIEGIFEKMRKSKDPKMVAKYCVLMGSRYMTGIDVPVDFDQARNFFARAAKEGNVEGMYKMGVLHQMGRGVKMDLKEAIRWFEQVIECGGNKEEDMRVVAWAQYAIGKCYEDGSGKNVDYEQAALWYERASEGKQGSGYAAHNLGMLYYKGLGVVGERDVERAIQYFKVAAERGVTISMDMLAWSYLHLGDLEDAQTWYSHSLEAGNLNSKLNKKNFDEALEHQRQSLLQVQSVCDLPVGSNMDECKAALRQKCEQEVSEAAAMFESLETVRKNHESSTHPTSLTKKESLEDGLHENKYFDNYQLILALSKEEGNEYARRLVTSMNHVMNARMLLLAHSEVQLLSQNRGENSVRLLSELSDALRASETPATLSIMEREKLHKIVSYILESKGTQKSQLDQDSRVCQSLFLLQSHGELEHFLCKSKLKYPLELYFHRLHSNMFGFSRRYREGAVETEKSLKLFPTDQDLLFCRASLSHYDLKSDDSSRQSEIKAAYHKFLDLASKDHRQGPEACYRLASFGLKFCQNGDEREALKESLKWYRNGLQMEKTVVPVYLPYVSNDKVILQGFLPLLDLDEESQDFGSVKREIQIKIEERKRKEEQQRNGQSSEEGRHQGAAGSSEVKGSKVSIKQLTNPKRIDIVKAHRKSFVTELKLMLDQSNSRLRLFNTGLTNPLKGQVAPIVSSSSDTFTSITFKEMNPTKSQVYWGRILKLRIVEDSKYGLYPSVDTIVMDENGDFQRCFIYMEKNEKTKQRIRNGLCFGSTISIVNPFFKLMLDESTGLRVDGLTSLRFLANGCDEQVCRFCAKMGDTKTCSKCKRAKYCGRECQMNDRNILKHSLICRQDVARLM